MYNFVTTLCYLCTLQLACLCLMPAVYAKFFLYSLQTYFIRIMRWIVIFYLSLIYINEKFAFNDSRDNIN
jgi:hypothetical protein